MLAVVRFYGNLFNDRILCSVVKKDRIAPAEKNNSYKIIIKNGALIKKYMIYSSMYMKRTQAISIALKDQNIQTHATDI